MKIKMAVTFNDGVTKDITATFADFVGSIKSGGFLIACGDDPGVKKLIEMSHGLDLKIITYGQGPDNDYQISRINLNPTGSTAQITINGRKAGELSLVVDLKQIIL